MKTLLFRGKVIPHTCLPAGARISRVRKMYSTTFKKPQPISFQIVTLETGVKVKVMLDSYLFLPLNRVLQHLT
jgi:hypothetical protein